MAFRTCQIHRLMLDSGQTSCWLEVNCDTGTCLCSIDLSIIFICVHELWVQLKLFGLCKEVAYTVCHLPTGSWAYGVLFVIHVEQHESQRDAVALFASYNQIQMKIRFGCIVGCINKDLFRF